MALAGCGTAPDPSALRTSGPAPDAAAAQGYDAVGVASWYGAAHHGRPTASGATFDKNALTAAHKSLAFGTRVEVTNLANRRSAVLTITDRGPYHGDRIIDVSERAAQLLGFHAAGLARVRVRALLRAAGLVESATHAS